MATRLYDNYNTGEDTGRTINPAAGYFRAQTWLASNNYPATLLKVFVYRVGSPGSVNVSLWSVSSGDPSVSLGSGTFDGDVITDSTAGEWVSITLNTSVDIISGTTYAVVLDDASSDVSNYIAWMADDENGYADGLYKWSPDSGANWNDQAADDLLFEIWGSDFPTDKRYSNRLWAVGSNEFWYESTPGTMVELASANGDLKTTNILTAVTAYQKVFIANRSDLKVADFVNKKLSTTDAGVNPCTRNMILTGGTSAAVMVVDYVDGVTDDAAMLVYGRRTSTPTFTSGETVTGTNSNGDAVSFVLNAAEVAAPHWYSWTPFGQDTTTYGVMPSDAYISCLYRGRLVLSGHAVYPHMWWMSRVADPWDWLYTENDPLSAIAGNNIDAGEVGDIIRAMIPNSDDFLLFGSADSIHILRGDPHEGGSIDKLEDTTGIYGPFAWCQDSQQNTFFWGTNGR